MVVTWPLMSNTNITYIPISSGNNDFFKYKDEKANYKMRTVEGSQSVFLQNFILDLQIAERGCAKPFARKVIWNRETPEFFTS